MMLSNGLDRSHVVVECDRSSSSSLLQQPEVDWSSCNDTAVASLMTGQYSSIKVDDVNTSTAVTWLLANGSNDNETFVAPMGLSPYVTAVITILYTIVIVVAVGGNTIVCCIVITQRRMHTVTNFFIVSLACSDILMASVCIPLNFIANVILEYWPFGAILCPIASYGQVVAVFLSAFTMLAISVDRYRAVIFPLRPRLTARAAAATIAITWIMAALVSLPAALFSQLVPRQGRDGILRDSCLEVWPDQQPDGFPLERGQRYAYSMAVMVLQYFLPLAILSFTYANIGVVIWAKRAPGEAENSRDQRLAASKRKMVKMMITVVVIYSLCWLPLHTITLIADAHPDIYYYRHIQLIWIACQWLAMSNCCYNPIVYCWMNAKFRAGFRHVFRFCPCVRGGIGGSSATGSHGFGTGGGQMTSFADGYSVVDGGGRRRFYSSAGTPSCSIAMTTAFDEPPSGNVGGDSSAERSPYGKRLMPGGCSRPNVSGGGFLAV